MKHSTPASLSITNSQSSLKLMSTESVMPSSHLILLSPSPPAPNPSQQTADSLENKSLMLGKIEGRRRRGCQRVRLQDDITDAMDMNLVKLREMERDREAWRAAVCGVTRVGHD